MQPRFKYSLMILLVVQCQGVSANSNNHELRLEEVSVTAQKRQESTREVPVSVTTVPSGDLNAFSASGDDVQMLAGRAPGLHVESSNGRIAPRFYLRGLGNVDFDLAASQPVSVIIDEVVQENVVLKSFPLFDLAQLEVIRGPQGTLFGRNTTAGILKFTSHKPTAETEGYFKAAYGTFDSTNLEGAIGGTLVENILLARVSLLAQGREDWIDNRYTGQKNAFGGLDERAGRVQFLLTPTDNFSALLNYHLRDLDGSQSAFQANVFTTGSNELNQNYDRDSVFYDGGNNNAQLYENSGGSLNMGLNFGTLTLNSITAVETAEGTNTGDIDGGVAGVGPGFIPFSSETVDEGDINQVSQELRLTNDPSSTWKWQMGGFYFDSDVSVTTDAGFNMATVHHENQSWALFGHNSYQINESLEIGAGARYTDDQREFRSSGIVPLEVADEHVSWDISLNYLLNDFTSIYTRVAEGFRAPSIQGRDVAFFGQPSVAQSETILSYEAGIKSDFFQDRLRVNAALFYYQIDDLQLSAIGGTGNSNRLLNSEEGIGHGLEIDLEAVPYDNLKLTLGFSYNDTEIRDSDLYTAVCGSGQCTPLDPLDAAGNANINGNPFQGAPKTTFNSTLRYQIPQGDSGLWFVFIDWVYLGATNLALYESKEFVTDGQHEGGLRLGYEAINGGYELAFFARNLTDEHNVKGFVDFNNNTGFVNEPRVLGIEFRGTY